MNTLLVDTNVWLELILRQANAEEARNFFNSTPPESLSITELALDSIGIILIRMGRPDAFDQFVADTLENSRITVVRLDPADLRRAARAHQDYKLDFEDAYQYIAAEKYDLTIVSFDSDFDRTPRGRKTPAQALKLK